jgi:hypothetical protein
MVALASMRRARGRSDRGTAAWTFSVFAWNTRLCVGKPCVIRDPSRGSGPAVVSARSPSVEHDLPDLFSIRKTPGFSRAMRPQPPDAVERAADQRPAGRGENIELGKSRQTRSSLLIFRLPRVFRRTCVTPGSPSCRGGRCEAELVQQSHFPYTPRLVALLTDHRPCVERSAGRWRAAAPERFSP